MSWITNCLAMFRWIDLSRRTDRQWIWEQQELLDVNMQPEVVEHNTRASAMRGVFDFIQCVLWLTIDTHTYTHALTDTHTHTQHARINHEQHSIKKPMKIKHNHNNNTTTTAATATTATTSATTNKPDFKFQTSFHELWMHLCRSSPPQEAAKIT